jgi:phospholipid/cholesterol/gamma-HCH transport system substrate-binding protein
VQANATTRDVDRALRSLVSVSTTLQKRERIINRAVREIEPAAAVLRRNTPGLTKLLRQVERFSGAAEDTVIRTRKDLIRVLDQVTPVLAELASNRTTYPLSLDRLITLADAVDGIVPGDYVGISLAIRLDGLGAPDLGGILEQLGIELPGLELPDLPELPELPGLPGPLGGISLGGLVRSGGR